jgi:hypothetical protein
VGRWEITLGKLFEDVYGCFGGSSTCDSLSNVRLGERNVFSINFYTSIELLCHAELGEITSQMYPLVGPMMARGRRAGPARTEEAPASRIAEVENFILKTWIKKLTLKNQRF